MTTRTRDTAIVVAVIGVVGSIVTTVITVLATRSTDSSPNPPAPQSIEVTVPGDEVWTDTGVDVDRGDTVNVVAEGVVSHNRDDPGSEAGPDGDDDVSPDLNTAGQGVYVYPPGHGGLIGKIGLDGVEFEIGERDTHPAEVDGRLYLGINDYGSGDPELGVSNNEGEFTVTIRIT